MKCLARLVGGVVPSFTISYNVKLDTHLLWHVHQFATKYLLQLSTHEDNTRFSARFLAVGEHRIEVLDTICRAQVVITL